MPTTREMRVWFILGIVLLWVMLGWSIADQFLWSTGGMPVEMVRHAQRTTARLDWDRMVGMGFGALMLTRMAYCVLRTSRDSGKADNG
jgi:hypothetical protein